MRFTPAYAGKIQYITTLLSCKEVHPRIRGEDVGDESCPLTIEGSPPHTRGRSVEFTSSWDYRRFTPAYAGKILQNRVKPRRFKVHPRIRGEDLEIHGADSAEMGSPPHTRGRFQQLAALSGGAGFTPAYAGKIVVSIRLF